jgi:biopolymer transport protein TolR
MGGADLGGSKESKAEPNVVPLCDILLVLLIIFMVVTPLLKEGVHVKLPEAVHTKGQPEPREIITVSIEDNGAIYLDSDLVDELGKLTAMIEERIETKKPSEKSKILLRADQEVIYERVTQVMEEIRKAQIEIVGLVAQEKVTTEQ